MIYSENILLSDKKINISKTYMCSFKFYPLLLLFIRKQTFHGFYKAHMFTL